LVDSFDAEIVSIEKSGNDPKFNELSYAKKFIVVWKRHVARQVAGLQALAEIED
jgi:hypothetical protein